MIYLQKAGDGYRKMLAIITTYNIYYAFIHCLSNVVGPFESKIVQKIINQGFIIDESGFLVFSKNLHKFGFWHSYVMMTVCRIVFHEEKSSRSTSSRLKCPFPYWEFTVSIDMQRSQSKAFVLIIISLRFSKYVSIFEKWYNILILVIVFFIVAIIYGLNCALDMLVG